MIRLPSRESGYAIIGRGGSTIRELQSSTQAVESLSTALKSRFESRLSLFRCVPMVSLNNLDQQIGALEEEEELSLDSDPEVEVPRVPRPSEGKRKLHNGEEQGKRRKSRFERNAVCFRYLEGCCNFEDCKFMHVSGTKLTHEERAQVLQELPKRAFSEGLAEVIKALNIPRCKDFHQRGGCKRPAGQCHFWHLTDAKVARWAGFNYWCKTLGLEAS